MATRRRGICVAVGVLVLVCFLMDSARPFVVGQAGVNNKTYPRQVLIIRHAEKPSEEANSVDLSPEGKKRAGALYQLFEGSEKRPSPFPTPDFIFAARDSRHSHRSVQTVTPLASKLKRPVHADIKNEDFARLVYDIFHNPRYAGKTILICWHHGTAPQLAHALQVAEAPNLWKGSVFDRVWQIVYDEQGKATFRDRPQQLLPGDSDR
jgi:hypothetical protein